MLHFGLLAIFFVIGFLVGASNTPVVGGFLSLLFGVIGAAVGSKYFFEEQPHKALRTQLGLFLVLIATGVLFGELAGEHYRNSGTEPKQLDLVWDDANAPEETFEAIDWIVVQDRMLSVGYSAADVKKLYQLRVKERLQLKEILESQVSEGVEFYEQVDVYPMESPYSERLAFEASARRSKSAGRGPASIE